MSTGLLDPASPCDTCAFRDGAAANLEAHNHLKGLICELGPLPFLCHHARDGRELNWRGSPVDFLLSASKQDLRVCAGWKGAVAKRNKAGFFSGPYKLIRRAVAQGALDSLVVFLTSGIAAVDKRDARLHVESCLRLLTRKNIGPLKIPFRKVRGVRLPL